MDGLERFKRQERFIAYAAHFTRRIRSRRRRSRLFAIELYLLRQLAREAFGRAKAEALMRAIAA